MFQAGPERGHRVDGSLPPSLNGTGLRRLFNATRLALSGFSTCFRTEEAFRQEIVLALFLIPLGLWLGETGVEKALLAGSLFLVLMVELLNTAIERTVDRISLDDHALSKDAKDIGSTAVFFSIILAVLVWSLILFF